MRVQLTRQDIDRLGPEGDLSKAITIEFHPGLWFIMAQPERDLATGVIKFVDCKPADEEASNYCREPIA